MNNRITITISSMAILSILVIITISGTQLFTQQSFAAPYIIQNTAKSIQDPLPGHESHQIVLAAPPRADGKIYSGIVTFTASEPVEVVVLHTYKPVTSSIGKGEKQTSSEPLNAPFGKGKVAITLMKKFTDSPVNSGSLVFAGNALAFHNLQGKPFTVTYTIDGQVNSLTQKQ